MGKRWRSIIVALGLLLAGANHRDPKSGREEGNAQQSIAASLDNISSRYNEQSKRVESAEKEDKPCSEGNYGSNADLCAQWKAADAAARSAWWAWAAGIAGIISSAGVILALGIGWHSNWIARDTARHQLRAYVSGELEDGLEFRIGGELDHAPIGFTNHGQTPAYKCRHAGDICLNTDEDMESYLSSETEAAARGAATYFSLQPTQVYAGTIYPSGDEALPTIFELETGLTGGKKLFVYGMLWYEDAFGEQRRTRYCYWVDVISPSIPVDDPDPDAEFIVHTGGLAKFRMAKFHNDAT